MTLEVSGTTALITGASAGLGVRFAHRFAERGANLVLVARRADRLERLADELRAAYGVQVTVVAADLGVAGAGRRLHADLAERGIRIDSLVNNAGFGTHGDFASADVDRINSEIQLNVATLVELSHAFMPDLLYSRGALINVASTAAFQPTPGMSVYGATKAFVLSFTEALWAEARNTGLSVIALCPGPTTTEFSDVAGSHEANLGRAQTADEVVMTAFRALDRRNPPPSVVSGSRNVATAAGVRLLTRRGAALLAAKLLGDVRMSARSLSASRF